MTNTFDAWEGEHLAHYGVLGMKWGMRRFQNKDGSLTPRGEKHYAKTGEYGYKYKSHATKKYERKAKRAKIWADSYRDSIKEVKAQNSHNDFHTERNNKFAKKWEKKAQKADAKYQKMLNRAKRSAEVDRGEQEYAKNLSTGKAIAGSLLLGGSVMKGYAQYRAMAGQKGNNLTGKKVLSGIKAYRAGSAGSRQRKAAYIRQDEGKRGLGQKVFRLENKIENAAGRILPERERQKKRRG